MKKIRGSEKLIVYVLIIAFFLISPFLFVVLFIAGLILWWLHSEGRLNLNDEDRGQY
jgi:uncharacterized SAM-binding protein YcdF (DUF218 family)